MMKRKILLITLLAAAHFGISITLGFLFFRSLPGKRILGADLSSSPFGWPLMVLLFPVRNIVNPFLRYHDWWLFERAGVLVPLAASIVWAVAIYHLVAWLAGRRPAA